MFIDEPSSLRISIHAREQWGRRFKKLRREGIMESQVERARRLGVCGGSAFLQTPCGAVLVVESDTVKTVLLGRHLSDGLLSALRVGG